MAVDNALENVVINKVADDFRIVPGSAEAGEGERSIWWSPTSSPARSANWPRRS